MQLRKPGVTPNLESNCLSYRTLSSKMCELVCRKASNSRKTPRRSSKQFPHSQPAQTIRLHFNNNRRDDSSVVQPVSWQSGPRSDRHFSKLSMASRLDAIRLVIFLRYY